MSSKKSGGGGGSSSSGGGFQSMNLSPPIFAGIKKLGYRTPTPVQRKSLPILLTGSDAVVMARTGSELALFVCRFAIIYFFVHIICVDLQSYIFCAHHINPCFIIDY